LVEDFAAAQKFYHNGWTDGLPVVPPTEPAVEAPSSAELARPPASTGKNRWKPQTLAALDGGEWKKA
jgi:hypothetical protein